MKQQVICMLENAGTEISGVKFTAHPEGGMLSEPISQVQAEIFLSIPGYVEFVPAEVPDQDKPPVLTKAEKEALAKAKKEQEAAEKAAAASEKGDQ